MDKEQVNRKIEALAREILSLAHGSLLVELPFLSRGLAQLEPVSDDKLSAGTDGEGFYYEPHYILALYRSEQTAVSRTLLHSLLHCIFHHSFVGRDIDIPRWNLACDIAVELSITELSSPVLKSGIEDRQISTLELLKVELKLPTAERIYKWLGEKGFDEQELSEMREPFMEDNHLLWYLAQGEDSDRELELKKRWEKLTEQTKREMELMEKEQSAAMTQNLRSLTQTHHDYSAFLRRFTGVSEQLRLSEDEFDQNYFSYGMELYGNIPLIEPLEYSERQSIRSFVIAIDTSGSVKGEVVQSFVQHTHDILCSQGSFASRMELHIMQCDDQLREDVLIRSEDEFKRYISEMEIKGLGKTDFRPVFRHIDALRSEGRLDRLQGLIYFTDGLGTFPSKRPDYETAFIIHTDSYEQPELPPWAIRLTLEEDDILDKRF